MPLLRRKCGALYYRVQGEGVPILFIHPPLLTSDNFNYQAEQLSRQYKIVTFDIRGHGYSDASNEAVTYPLIVQDMVQLMDSLGIQKAYVCGYSTGGGVALEALLSYPERFSGAVVISGMSEASDWRLRSRISLAVALTAMKAKQLLSLAIVWGNANNRAMFDTLLRTARQGCVDNWQQYYRSSLLYDSTARLSAITAPVLMIYGERDKRFFRYADKLKSVLPQSELVWIAGAKHQIPTKHAHTMNMLIERWIQHMEPAHRTRL
ncbi:alpha/beta fold hydrolase [Paenibacillus sp. 481]|uniref:alpha/beta fold hydrolase n=1 Tax=Paenibacillus sp. 481 TaxID=2835869 RepID=UPI001E38835F|nr:alpha/beta hydrolase [Paenibacillus sp. 481]UHA74253.1 alpha/beta hydrolase [Paenibacillus sp. 481]